MIAAIVAVAGTAGVGVAGAAGSSGAATDVTIYAVEDGGTFCFSLNQTTCDGEVVVPVNGATNKVTWAFPGPYTQPHNASSRGTNWTYKSHDPSTDPAAVVDPDYDFTTNGTYEFVCDAHPILMTGKIVVTGGADATATTTPTTTPTATPTSTATTQPSGLGTTTPPPTGGTQDLIKPTLQSLGTTARRRAVTVRFRLSENATVNVRVKRGTRVIKSVVKQLAAGQRSVSVRSSKLKKGRYKAEVRARDASGNVSTLATKSFRIRR